MYRLSLYILLLEKNTACTFETPQKLLRNYHIQHACCHDPLKTCKGYEFELAKKPNKVNAHVKGIKNDLLFCLEYINHGISLLSIHTEKHEHFISQHQKIVQLKMDRYME